MRKIRPALACLAAAAMLVACAPKEEPECCAQPPQDQTTQASNEPLGIPFDTPETPACQAGLKAKGLTASELWVMLHPPAGVCPNVGVTEARIREIVGFWEAAGCKVHTPKDMLHALESGACGGDAG